MEPEVQYYHSFTVMLKMHDAGYKPTDYQLKAWSEFAESVMAETRSLVGLCYSTYYGAYLFTFALKDDAWAFLESWRSVLAGNANWPFDPTSPNPAAM